ncbi:uncharacterized protein [Typha angustifolia]|uniref:uncharacterized protein n=1 Tax=Typha angustifolia TaxID=59011 RepID=UPI003C2F5411
MTEVGWNLRYALMVVLVSIPYPIHAQKPAFILCLLKLQSVCNFPESVLISCSMEVFNFTEQGRCVTFLAAHPRWKSNNNLAVVKFQLKVELADKRLKGVAVFTSNQSQEFALVLNETVGSKDSTSLPMKSLGIHRILHLTGDNSGRSKQKKPAVSSTILVLVFSNLVLTLLCMLDHSPSDTKKLMRFEPLKYIISKLFAILMVYSATVSYDHRLSIEEMISRIRRTWKGLITTLIYVEIYAVAFSSLLSMLKGLLGLTDGVVMTIFVVLGLVALVSHLWSVLFAYSDIACKISMVVSIMEDGYEGLGAIERAEEITKGRKTQGFFLVVAMTLVEQAVPLRWHGLVLLLVHYISCNAYTLFYYECKRGHGSKATSLDGEKCN